MRSPGVTLDTGALIALERGERRMRHVVRLAEEDDVTVTVPAVVLIEWWRGPSKGGRQQQVLNILSIEPTTEWLAKIAGEALASLNATAVDAAVMASAAQRGDVVYTSDVGDLERLRQHFPGVRVFSATG